MEIFKINSRVKDIREEVDSIVKNACNFQNDMIPEILSGNYIILTTSNYNMVFDICGCCKDNFAKLGLWEKMRGWHRYFLWSILEGDYIK